jgi:long-chain acyl-CoA synthetase
VQALLRQRIDRVLKDVSKSEQIKKIMILPNPFTMAADELTVSLKLRRNVVLKKYASQLDALYKEGRDAADDD